MSKDARETGDHRMTESERLEGGISFPTVDGTGRTCPGQLEIPTPREQKALAAMRAIKEQVKPLKERLTSLEKAGMGSGPDGRRVQEALGRLKEDWDRWEAERKAAAKERMVLLGHEAPD